MSPSLRRKRHHGFDTMRHVELARAIHQLVSEDPGSPPATLVGQLTRVGRESNLVSLPHRRILRQWLLRYLQPLLETIDGQEFILEVERQQPTEGTEA